MATRCRDITETITEYVEEWVEREEARQEERCREEKCNWWVLCLNKLVCWVVWVVIKIVEKVLVPVVRTIVRTVCEVVSLALDLVALFVGLVLSIPLLGGVLRTIIDWVSEIANRVLGIFDFVLSLAGVRLRKRMYVGLIATRADGKPLADDPDRREHFETSIAVAKALLHRRCNVELVYTGRCEFANPPPEGVRRFQCNAGGFFGEWLHTWYYEMAALSCRPRDSWRRIAGHGAELLGFIVERVEPAKAGCAFANHPYFVLAAGHASTSTLLHEIGHCCMLTHRDTETTNLMYPSGSRDAAAEGGDPENLVITTWQAAVIRSSRYCSYF